MAEPDESPDPKDAKSSMESGKKSPGKTSTWIENLAQRSTGLPKDENLESPPDTSGDKSLWRMAGIGFQFAATIGLFAFMGYELDRKMGWSPWGIISLSMIALIGSFYLLIKETLMEPNAPKKKKK